MWEKAMLEELRDDLRGIEEKAHQIRGYL